MDELQIPDIKEKKDKTNITLTSLHIKINISHAFHRNIIILLLLLKSKTYISSKMLQIFINLISVNIISFFTDEKH